MKKQQISSGVRIFPPVIHVAAIAIGFLVQWAAPVRIGGSGRQLALSAGCVVLGTGLGLIAWAATVMFRAGTTAEGAFRCAAAGSVFPDNPSAHNRQAEV